MGCDWYWDIASIGATGLYTDVHQFLAQLLGVGVVVPFSFVGFLAVAKRRSICFHLYGSPEHKMQA